MKIDDSILLTRDFDIFFRHETDGGIIPVHCATFGSLLPEDLNDDDYILSCGEEIATSPLFLPLEKIVIQDDNVNHVLGHNTPEGLLNNEERRNAYIRTFVNMARKGFWSFDRYHRPHSEPHPDDNRFILIAFPRRKADRYPCLKLCNQFTLINHYNDIIR